MQTSLIFDIQRRHVEQSKHLDIRTYAAEMLKLEEAKKTTKSKRKSASQPKSSSRKVNRGKKQARCSVTRAPVPVTTNENIHRATMVSNDIAYQQLEQTILQGNAVNRTNPVNGRIQNMPAPSHMPSTMAPIAMSDITSPYATRENDGQGMDETCFQELLAGFKTGLQIVSQPNPVPASFGPVNAGQVLYAKYPGTGIITRDSLSAGSQASCNERQSYLSSCLTAMRTENDTSMTEKIAGLSMTAARGKPNTKPKGAAKVGNRSPKKGTQAISDGVSKKGKPTKKVGILKKKDFFCPYDGCGKAFERRYNLKVHTRRHTGEMPYTCPKTEDGCFLYFRWRSSLRHHLKTVHHDVVPISQNNTRGRVTANRVIQAVNAVSGHNTSFASSVFASSVSGSTSSAQSSGSPLPGVSRSGGIKKAKKQGKARKNFPAVAVRQPTAQELAQLYAAALSKSSTQTGQVLVPEKSAQAQAGIITQENNVQASRCDPPPAEEDLMDISIVPSCEEVTSTSPSSSNDDDDIFDGMDFDIPGYLALPKLYDLPSPEEFFYGA